MEIFKGEPILWKFAPHFNWFFLQEDSITENISMGICSSQFAQKYYYIRCIKWCKFWFGASCTLSTSRISSFTVISGSTILPSSVAKLFLVSVYHTVWCVRNQVSLSAMNIWGHCFTVFLEDWSYIRHCIACCIVCEILHKTYWRNLISHTDYHSVNSHRALTKGLYHIQCWRHYYDWHSRFAAWQERDSIISVCRLVWHIASGAHTFI